MYIYNIFLNYNGCSQTNYHGIDSRLNSLSFQNLTKTLLGFHLGSDLKIGSKNETIRIYLAGIKLSISLYIRLGCNIESDGTQQTMTALTKIQLLNNKHIIPSTQNNLNNETKEIKDKKRFKKLI